MHDARFGIFRLAEKFCIDPGVGALLLRPSLLLKARDIDGVDLLLQNQTVIDLDLGLGIKRELMRLVGRDVQRIDRAGLILRHHAAVKFLAEPPIDMRRQFHARRRQRLDRGAKARQGIDEGMDGSAALEIAGNCDLQDSRGPYRAVEAHRAHHWLVREPNGQEVLAYSVARPRLTDPNFHSRLKRFEGAVLVLVLIQTSGHGRDRLNSPAVWRSIVRSRDPAIGRSLRSTLPAINRSRRLPSLTLR